MQGTIVKIVAADGEQVAVGDTIVVLEAMKMEQPLTAHKAGTVTGLSHQRRPDGTGRSRDLPAALMARLPGDPGVLPG